MVFIHIAATTPRRNRLWNGIGSYRQRHCTRHIINTAILQPCPTCDCIMTDRYFPQSIPNQTDLDTMLSVIYTFSDPNATKGTFTLTPWDHARKISLMEKTIQLPNHYWDHVRRTMWRKMAFGEIYRLWKADNIQLPHDFIPLVKKYIAYLDAMLEGLLTSARKRVKHANYRSNLFDTYLVVEGSIMRHEHDVVGEWRLSHSETILECLDAFDLGGC